MEESSDHFGENSREREAQSLMAPHCSMGLGKGYGCEGFNLSECLTSVTSIHAAQRVPLGMAYA